MEKETLASEIIRGMKKRSRVQRIIIAALGVALAAAGWRMAREYQDGVYRAGADPAAREV